MATVEWKWTLSAQRRMVDLNALHGLQAWEVKAALVRPLQDVPARDSHLRYYTHGRARVLVEPESRTIITVEIVEGMYARE